MGSKYILLKEYLQEQNKPYIKMSFDSIEKILGFELPKSAYRHRAWWANDEYHTHARNGWLAAGYKVRNVDFENRVVEFVKDDSLMANPVEFEKELFLKPQSYSSLNVNLSLKDAESFEKLARKVMSEYYGTKLEKRRKPGWPKEFDLVSPDYKIVGDAKYYTMVKGSRLPPAKFATISEYVWMLESIDAEERFLVFGNDKRVPVEWLKRYKNLVKTVKFYYIDEKGHLERLL